MAESLPEAKAQSDIKKNGHLIDSGPDDDVLHPTLKDFSGQFLAKPCVTVLLWLGEIYWEG